MKRVTSQYYIISSFVWIDQTSYTSYPICVVLFDKYNQGDVGCEAQSVFAKHQLECTFFAHIYIYIYMQASNYL